MLHCCHIRNVQAATTPENSMHDHAAAVPFHLHPPGHPVGDATPKSPKDRAKTHENFANSDVHRNAQNSAEKCRTMPFEGAKVARKVARFTVLNVTPLL